MLATFFVTNTADAVENTPEAVGTLRQAIFDANQFADADTINFDISLNGGTIQLSDTAAVSLRVTRSVTIDATMLPLGLTIDASGLDSDPTVVDGGGVSVFAIEAPSPQTESLDVTLEGLTITGGDAFFGGGGISFGSQFRDVTLGKLTISKSNIVDNGGLAGGVFAKVAGADVEIVDTTISGNVSTFRGGGAYATLRESSSLLIERSTVSGNTAATDGGGVFAKASADEGNPFPSPRSITIAESLISGNTAFDRGGGLYLFNYDGTETLVTDSRITGNEVPAEATGNHRNGGGIYAYVRDQSDKANQPRITITQSTVDDNEAEHEGGGIFVCAKYHGEFVATNVTISGNRTLNQSTGAGGGLFIARFDATPGETVDAYLRNVTVTQNTSASGGGLGVAPLSDIFVRVANSIISENFDHQVQPQPNNLDGRIVASEFKFNLVGSGSTILDHITGNPVTPDSTNKLNNNTPLLNPLVYRGGPTPTHAPRPSSPVRDQGSNALASDPFTGTPFLTDQRGVNNPRLFDIVGVGNGPGQFIVDIGAYEIGPLARVGDVRLDNATWQRDPYSFGELVLAGEQLRPVATQNVTTVEIVFGGHVRKKLSAGGVVSDIASTPTEGNMLLELRRTRRDTDGTALNDSVGATGFTYNATTYTAVWTFPTLADGKYAIHLRSPASNQAGIVNSTGQELDSNWVNLDNGTPDIFGDDPRRGLSDGDSVEGSVGNEFRFHFALLKGDYDGDGVVEVGAEAATGDGDGDGDAGDAQDLAIGVNGNALPLRKIGGADLADDEIINTSDLAIWKNGWGPTGVAGDVDGDGDSDGNDFLIWQRAVGDISAWYDGPPPGPPPVYGLVPRVSNVIVSGSLSNHAPYSLDTVDGSGNQLVTIPVGGADTISIVFSEAVNVAAESLVVIGMRTGVLPELAAFSYVAATKTATWRFEGWALADQYLLALSDEVTDVDGNWLDGEWTNPASRSTTAAAVSEFPSGNGSPGGWFNFVVSLMPGDANLDGIVNGSDFSILAANWGQQFGRLFVHADFNGDGAVDGADYSYLAATFNLNFQTLWVMADFDGDFDVDEFDLDVIADNGNMTGATWADGDLNGDGAVTMADLDLALAQYGLALSVVA